MEGDGGRGEGGGTYMMRRFMNHQTPRLVLVSMPSSEIIRSVDCILPISFIL
jgi:hypothetical protein